MAQRWHDLAFLHWSVPEAALRPLVPEGLSIDLFEGRAYLGVVPFRMSRIRKRLLPPLPGLSAFPELNVRTYVERDGKPGVWFLSLDAANGVAVATARRWFRLPYFRARISLEDREGWIRYRCERTHRGAAPARFEGRYRAAGPLYRAQPGTLDHWLTERYCLYAAGRRGRLLRAEILHPPWPLAPGEAEISRNTMAEASGIRLPDAPPLLHVAREIRVAVWSPEPC